MSELPIRKVTLLEDRAQIERRGELELPQGTGRLRIEGIAPAAVDRSLRVEIAGGRVLEARFVRAWKEKPLGGLEADASELKKTVHALGKELEALGDEQARIAWRRELVLKARADLLREINEATGFGRVDGPSWAGSLEALSEQERKLDDVTRSVGNTRVLAERKLGEARMALAVAEKPEPAFTCALEITVDGTGGHGSVRASYLVPCALWRPAYRASLRGETVTLECDAVIWQNTGEDWVDVALAFSTARPTLGTTAPALAEDVLRLRPKQDAEKRVVTVQVREQVIQTSGEGGPSQSSEMPGLDDGGEAVLLAAPSSASVPSDGAPHRVSLSSFSAAASVERVCAPELSPVVSLVARFPNSGAHVLLAGPVDLVRSSGFVGRGALKFSALGETVLLSFGSEDGMRAIRQLEQKQDEARLTGRRTTRHLVRIYLSNATSQAARIVLEERIPVSEVKEVDVQVLAKECKPAPTSVSKEGIARFEVQCSAGATLETSFVWELSAAARVSGL